MSAETFKRAALAEIFGTGGTSAACSKCLAQAALAPPWQRWRHRASGAGALPAAARREAGKSGGSEGFRMFGREENRDRSPRKKKSKGWIQNQRFWQNEIQSRHGAATRRERQAKRQPRRKSKGLIRNQWFWRNEIQSRRGAAAAPRRRAAEALQRRCCSINSLK